MVGGGQVPAATTHLAGVDEHWTPWLPIEREMQGMMNRLERLLGETAERFPSLRPGFTWQPTTDITKEDGRLVFRAEIPGIDPDKDVEIGITGNVLHIKGQKTVEREAEEDDRYLSERFFGTFERSFTVPEGVVPEDIRATYEAGVLTVEVPLPEEEKAETRRIEVTTR